jgi:crotonobetainyl-CoA:carnitine CoA-transferase CaiB-like acyl-CoA transferase
MARFGTAIGHPELLDHPAYATNSMRVKNRVILESRLAEIFRTDTRPSSSRRVTTKKRTFLDDFVQNF